MFFWTFFLITLFSGWSPVFDATAPVPEIMVEVNQCCGTDPPPDPPPPPNWDPP